MIGLFYFFVENANIHIKVFPKVETREGQDYINIDRVRAKFTTTKWVYWYIINSNFVFKKVKCLFVRAIDKFESFSDRFIPHFTNLFNDEKLSKNMNLFLQQNSDDIFREVKVSIENAVAGVVKDVLSGPFGKFPYKDLFLPWILIRTKRWLWKNGKKIWWLIHLWN